MDGVRDKRIQHKAVNQALKSVLHEVRHIKMAPMNNGRLNGKDEVRCARLYKPWENGLKYDI